jgi:transposase
MLVKITAFSSKKSSGEVVTPARLLFIAVLEWARYDQGRANAENLYTLLHHFKGDAMKPYSIDFREKIIEVYCTESLSIRQVAKRFAVAKSFVQKLLKQLRETGDLHPKPHGGGRRPKLHAEQLNLVATLVESDNDATLSELCDRLQAETSMAISRSTMSRVLQTLQLTRKKKHCTRARRLVPECSEPG